MEAGGRLAQLGRGPMLPQPRLSCSHPQATFLFSLIKTVAAGYMSIPFLSDIGLSDNFYKSLPYIITLLVLTFSANRAIGPKAAGQPYDKGRR